MHILIQRLGNSLLRCIAHEQRIECQTKPPRQDLAKRPQVLIQFNMIFRIYYL